MIKSIGKHKVQHANVMNGIDKLMEGQLAQIVYSDPPWGQGNLSYWQTMNNKMTGAEKEHVDYNNFLNQIFSIAYKYSKDIVFIEYGIQWEKDIIELGTKHGLKHIGLAHPIYRSGSRMLPLHLHIFAKSNVQLPNGYLDSIKDTYGLETLKRAIKPFVKEGEIILDPCCGMGYCAQMAIDNNMVFRGNELNEKRLSKTINRLEKDAKK
jgi:hypothetical protein